jgi:hypothetical protein
MEAASTTFGFFFHPSIYLIFQTLLLAFFAIFSCLIFILFIYFLNFLFIVSAFVSFFIRLFPSIYLPIQFFFLTSFPCFCTYTNSWSINVGLESIQCTSIIKNSKKQRFCFWGFTGENHWLFDSFLGVSTLKSDPCSLDGNALNPDLHPPLLEKHSFVALSPQVISKSKL